MKQLMIDPPEGWRYGFPKPVHEEFHTLGDDFDLARWLVSEGYPDKDIELALEHSRYYWVEIGMTFEEWLDEIDGCTSRREQINESVDFAAVMTGHMSHNLARTKMYDWLEAAYTVGQAAGYSKGFNEGYHRRYNE